MEKRLAESINKEKELSVEQRELLKLEQHLLDFLYQKEIVLPPKFSATTYKSAQHLKIAFLNNSADLHQTLLSLKAFGDPSKMTIRETTARIFRLQEILIKDHEVDLKKYF